MTDDVENATLRGKVEELEEQVNHVVAERDGLKVVYGELRVKVQELEREVARLKELIQKVRSGSKLAADLIDTLT
jgi:predicted  nucleic acid-binding Zn-ribbon protein